MRRSTIKRLSLQLGEQKHAEPVTLLTKKQQKQIRDGRQLARRILYYFERGPIQPFFDSDIALRDLSLELLGHRKCGSAPIPDEIWKKIFRPARPKNAKAKRGV